MDYRQAGVDIEAGNEVVRRIKKLARATFTPGVLSDIGSFGGLFRLKDAALTDPVLVSSADGRYQIASRLHDRRALVHRPGPGKPLRQRHPRARGRAVVLPGLSRHRPSES